MLLFTPGPVALPGVVLAQLAANPLYHRSSEFRRIFGDTLALLRPRLGVSSDDIFLTPGSGTAVMDMVASNLFTRGDRVVVFENGYFGKRIVQLLAARSLRVTEVSLPMGQQIDASMVHRAGVHPDTRGVFIVHLETSTGAVNDISGVRRYLPVNALLVADCVSSAGVLPVEAELWGIDVAVSASQKGLGGLPGIGMFTVSKRAWERKSQLGGTSLVSDWESVRRAYHRADGPEMPWTPPVSIVSALHDVLVHSGTRSGRQIEDNRPGVTQSLRSGLIDLGFSDYLAGIPSPAPLLVMRPPPGHSAGQIHRYLARRGCFVGDGLGQLAGEVLRFGLYGAIGVKEVELLLELLAGR